MSNQLPRHTALLLFVFVVLVWGCNWPVTKMIVETVPPLWTTSIRCVVATLALLPLLLWQGNLVLPRRGDMPIVLGISLLHMVAFSTLIAFGLMIVPANRAVVLGYTTPLWVIPGARLFLREPVSMRQVAGVALGIGGLAVMFNPVSFDWGDTRALIGNGIILLAALCWAVSILQVRAHKWVSTPFQLVFWETLLAACVLALLALLVEGLPHLQWSPRLVALFVYAGVPGTALAYWAMTTVNRSLPAATTSIGLLATPAVGTLCAALVLGEPVTLPLVCAMVLIGGGIALGTFTPAPRS